jgi:hypothetical protein
MSRPRHRPARNWGARIHQIAIGGLPAIVLENELLRVTVLAGLGADVIEFCYKPRDLDLTWLSPRPDHRRSAAPAADDVAAFLDRYRGGWQEVFPNGGAPARYRGAALAQHGEVAGLCWDASVTADAEDAVEATFTTSTTRMPFELRKTMRLAAGTAELAVSETAVNTSPVPLAAMWGQHLAFGPPFLTPGSRIRLPPGVEVIPHPVPIDPPHRRVRAGGPWNWPVVPGDAVPDGDVDLSVLPEWGAPSDIVYLTGFRDGWYELTAPSGAGVRVEWDAAALPFLWMWQELGATRGYPWWGQGRLLGLEPFSSYPTDGLAEAEANGTALAMAGGAERRLWWRVSMLEVEVR